MERSLGISTEGAELKRAWVAPVLATLTIEETLGGTIPNQPESFIAGNSGNHGRLAS